MPYRVYILASKKNGVLYIGVTGNISRRIMEHKTGYNDGFTKRYFIHKLVYVEQYVWILNALAREKQLKKRSRKKKIALIEKDNAEWNELKIEL